MICIELTVKILLVVCFFLVQVMNLQVLVAVAVGAEFVAEMKHFTCLATRK